MTSFHPAPSVSSVTFPNGTNVGERRRRKKKNHDFALYSSGVFCCSWLLSELRYFRHHLKAATCNSTWTAVEESSEAAPQRAALLYPATKCDNSEAASGSEQKAQRSVRHRGGRGWRILANRQASLSWDRERKRDDRGSKIHSPPKPPGFMWSEVLSGSRRSSSWSGE